MGSFCSSPTTVNQTQTYTPNPYAAGAITGSLNQAQNVAQTPFHTPVAPVAGFSPDQYNAFQGVRNAQGQAQPYLDQAQNYFAGNNVSQFLNPFASNVMAGLKDVFGQQQQQTTGNLTQQAGGVGADRIAVGQADLAKQQGLAAGQTLAGLYQPALAASQNAGFGIGALGPVAQNAALQGSQAMLGTGGLQQQLAQAQMNAPYQNQLAAIQWPYQNAQFGANITGALAPGLGGTTAGGTKYPPASPWGTIAGLGMAGAGVYGVGNQNGWWSGSGGGTSGVDPSGNPYASGGVVGYADGGGEDSVDDQIHSAEIKELQDAGNPAVGGIHAQPMSGSAPINVAAQSMIPNGQIQAIQPHIPQLSSPQQGGSGSGGIGMGDIVKMATAVAPLLLNRGGAVSSYAEGGVAKGDENSGNSPYYDKFLRALRHIRESMDPVPQTGSLGSDMLAALPFASTALRPSAVRLTPTNRPDPQLQMRGRFTRLQDSGAYMQHPAVGKAGPIWAGQLAANAYQHHPEDSAPEVRHDDTPEVSNPFADRFGEMAPASEPGPRQDPLFAQSAMHDMPPSREEAVSSHVPIPRSNPFVGPALQHEARKRAALAPIEEFRAPPYRASHMADGGVPDEAPAWPFLEGIGHDTPDLAPSVPEYARRGPLRSMAAGRPVADWRQRDPEAAAQETGEKWRDIYNDPAGSVEGLGLTGQIIGSAIRNASPNAAQAEPAGGKKTQPKQSANIQPDPELLKEQKALAAEGFYEGVPDGLPGVKTQNARKAYREAQERLRQQELDKLKLGATTQTETNKTLELKNQQTLLEQQGQENERKEQERKEGLERLREAEKNLPFRDRMMRDYGHQIGGLGGTMAGAIMRYTAKKGGDLFAARQAAQAEKILGNPTGPVTAENLAERIGKTNDWWRKGGGKEPFVSTPFKNPGAAVNVDKNGVPIGTPIGQLFQHGKIAPKVVDTGALGTIGATGYLNDDYDAARERFNKAKLDVDEKPSDVNIEAYLTARRHLDNAEAKRYAVGSAAGSYVGSSIYKPRRPIIPPTDVADKTKLEIERFLREGESAAQRAAKAAATRQARKMAEAAKVESGAAANETATALPSNPLRKFDNQGNLIKSRSKPASKQTRKKKVETPPIEETPISESPTMQASGGRVNPYAGKFEAAGAVPFLDYARPSYGASFQSAEAPGIAKENTWLDDTLEGIRSSTPPGGIPIGYKFPTLGNGKSPVAPQDGVSPIASSTRLDDEGDSSNDGEHPSYLRADQGSTNGANPYAASMPKRGKDLIDNPWMALVQAGLGTMAAAGTRDARGLPTSPMAAIGQGGMKGMEALREQQAAGIKQQSIEQAAKRLDQQAQFHQDQFKANEAYRQQRLKNEDRRNAELENYRAAVLAGKTPASGKPLPSPIQKDLGEKAQTFQTLDSLSTGFKPEYSGWGSSGVGDAANWAARQLGMGNKDAADWWQQYQAYRNTVRHKLFGSALTQTEAAEWEKQDINPGTQPDVIQGNLKRQTKIIESAMERRAKSLTAQGYSKEAIEAELGRPLGGSTEPKVGERKQFKQGWGVWNGKEWEAAKD